MKVSLHIGAHKTASTYLQSALERHAAPLAELGTGVVPLAEFRSEVTRPLKPRDNDPKRAFRQERARRFLEAQLGRADVGRIVLSDENLLGDPAQVVESAALYPDARERLLALAPFLAGHEVEVFLALRHLGEYSRSIYCEALWWMKGDFVPEVSHKAAWRDGAQSWAVLVENVRAAFPAAKITVWPHAMIRTHPELVLSTVAGVGTFGWTLDGVYKRRSLSTDATLELMRIGATEGTEAMRAAAHRLHKRHKQAPGNPTYRMWGEDDNKAFNRRFWSDLTAIRKLSPKVRVLKAPSEG